MKENFDVNLVTWLWMNIGSFSILKHMLLKFMKLAKIACLQVLGSIKDAQYFSTIAFMKNKSKNHLITHLDLCTWFNAQYFYNLQNCPIEKAMN